MPVTPIQRLVDELAHVRRRDYPALAKRAGVVVREIERAAAGTQLRPGQYLKLCAALGIKAASGERVPPRRLGDFDWEMFRLGVEMRRRLSKRMTMRQAVAAIGRRVGLSTMSRVANAKPISITSIIAIC
ncbi:MAG: hypothetical protein JSR72_23325, partial [Proteobacteria bacterium]|nr:hypothetical protein [Pseudomonadota bacterium]